MKTYQKKVQDMKEERSLLHPLTIYVQNANLSGHLTEEDKLSLLRGIKLYQEHEYRRRPSVYETIWQNGEASLRYFEAAKKNTDAALFIIPSMINKSYILDLMQERSFIGFLTGNNIDVYLLDWGVPKSDTDIKKLDDVLDHRICRAAEEVVAQHKGNNIHALGYCMGGTLLAGAAQKLDGKFRSNIYLAAPWDFRAGDQKLARAVRTGAPMALQMIGNKGHLPAAWIENIFASVQADKSIEKFIRFSEMEQKSKKAALFVAVEDWLHDGLDLPGDIATKCLRDWYLNNDTAKRKWKVGGETLDLSRVKTRSLIVASEQDKLVPSRSSISLAHQLANSEIMQPPCGHIGMMTSKNAEEVLWQPMLDWIMVAQ